MKRFIRSSALIAALAVGAAAMPVNAQWLGYGNGYWDATETELWESDNWANDEYGVFDQDFAWDADAGFDTWYGDSASAWNEYDDVGDGGWFDV